MAIYVGKDSKNLQLISSVVTKDRVKSIIIDGFLPAVGSVKYLARRNPIPVNTGSDSFDGWVYADGGAYSRADFPTASSVFGSRFGGNDSVFNVPDLRNFIKSQLGNLEIQTVQSSACVPNHYHNVNTTIKYTADHVLKSAFTICQTGTSGSHYVGNPSDATGILTKLDASNYKAYVNAEPPFEDYVPGLHGGDSKVSSNDHQVMVDLNIPAKISFKVIGCGYAGEDYPDAYPAHKLLQVMVYIGRRGN